MTARIRVLVVDDSAFARKVLRESLRAAPDLEIVGSAADGLEALEMITALAPDVVTLDLVMPNLDGVGVIQALPLGGHVPRVVVVSAADGESELGIAALRAGAVELVHKPTAQATYRLAELRDELIAKVRTAGGARAHARPLEPAPPPPPAPAIVTSRKLVVIGASTGGPQALTRLLRALPANFPVPIALVLHIPMGYTLPFAQRLDAECAVHVVEAKEGLVLEPGMVVVARGGMHLTIEAAGEELRAHLGFEPTSTAHRPGVDVLFGSVVALGRRVVAIVLTGMGDDGAAQSAELHKRGATVLTEAESSCVVYGMPRAVVERGASTASAPIDEMAALLLRHLV